jgi:hypothetical protein
MPEIREIGQIVDAIGGIKHRQIHHAVRQTERPRVFPDAQCVQYTFIHLS